MFQTTLKRITCLLSAVCIIFTICNIPAFAADDNTNTMSRKESKGLGLLRALGVIDPAVTDLNAVVKREELAEFIIKAMAFEAKADEYSGMFSDVTAEHPKIRYIEAAAKLGIMSGAGDGKFCPDDQITVIQAAKVYVCLLGYYPLVQQKGGYPIGYLTIAREKDLLSETDFQAESPMNLEQLIDITYRALKTPVFKPEKYGENITYAVNKNDTLLRQNFSIDYDEGIVKACGKASLRYGDHTADNMCIINSGIFKNGSVTVLPFLGYYCEYYYRTDNTENGLVYIVEAENKNTVTEIEKDNLIRYEDKTYYYDLNGRTETVKFQGMQVIYNGRAITSFDERFLAPFWNGSVKIIDYDNDGIGDVAFVYDYYNIIVDRVIDTMIYGQNRVNGNLDLLDKDYDIVDKEDKKILLEDIPSGVNLSAFISEDQQYAKVIVCDQKKKVVIEGVTKEKETVITIEGVDYHSSLNKDGTAQDISVGETVTAWFDYKGTISHFITENIDYSSSYGYLIKVVKLAGVGDRVQFKLLTIENAKIVVEGAPRILIDGNSYNKADDILNLLSENGSMKSQLIKFTLSKDNYLKSIDTEKTNVGEEEDTCLRKTYDSPDGKVVRYRHLGEIRIFDNFAVFSPQTLVITTPRQGEDDDYYRVVKIDDILIDTQDYSDLKIYTTGKKKVTADVIVMKYGTNYKSAATMMVVDKITKALDERGQVIAKIKGYTYTGGSAEILVDNPGILSTIKPLNVKNLPANQQNMTYPLESGDVILYNVDYSNEVQKDLTSGDYSIWMLYDYSDTNYSNALKTKGTTYDPSGVAASNRIYVRDIYQREDIYFSATTTDLKGDFNSDALNLEYYRIMKTTIVFIEPSGSGVKVYASSYNKLNDYFHNGRDSSRILFNIVNGYVNGIIAIKK